MQTPYPLKFILKKRFKSSFFILYFSISNRTDMLSHTKAYFDVFSQYNPETKENNKTLDIMIGNAI